MELSEISLRQLTVNVQAHSKQWWDENFFSNAPFETSSRLLFIKFGRLAYEIDGTGAFAEKNQLLLIPEHRHVKYYVPKGEAVNVQSCNFRIDCGGECIFDFMEGKWIADIADPKAVNEMFERFHRVRKENIILDCLEKKETLLKLLCVFLENSELSVNRNRTNSSRIDFEGIADYIKRNVNSKDKMTIENLAEMAHVHYNYFISEFRRHFGVSPMQYILNERINAAKSHLAKTDESIRDIAENMHFENVKYFSSFFKKRTGMTPREYRNAAKNSTAEQERDGE